MLNPERFLFFLISNGKRLNQDWATVFRLHCDCVPLTNNEHTITNISWNLPCLVLKVCTICHQVTKFHATAKQHCPSAICPCLWKSLCTPLEMTYHWMSLYYTALWSTRTSFSSEPLFCSFEASNLIECCVIPLQHFTLLHLDMFTCSGCVHSSLTECFSQKPTCVKLLQQRCN